MATARKALRTHQVQGAQVEPIQYMEYSSGQTFILGEVLQYDGSTGKIKVSVADPASGTIVGVALQGAGTSPGFDAANSPATFTGRAAKVSVVRPNDDVIFQAELTNGSSTVVTPAITDQIQLGITAYSGVWTVDKAKTGGSARVQVIGFDTDQNVVFFKFLSSFLA